MLHPVVLSALVVLIANDHWLKYARLLPAWLTGKLSDFAGLIIAPVVLMEVAALLRLRGTGWTHALAATFVTGLTFALVKTAPAANAVYANMSQTLLAPFGWGASTLLDPTDLLALVALAVPLRLASEGK